MKKINPNRIDKYWSKLNPKKVYKDSKKIRSELKYDKEYIEREENIERPVYSENGKNYKKEKSRKKLFWRVFRNLLLIFISLGLITATAIAIYVSTITIPDFSNFANRRIDNSTQIYDKTGKILLYDVHGDVKRVQVAKDEIPKLVKDATVAIEDKHFYEHHGIRPTSIIRAILVNIQTGSFSQGGSTIDQQIIKNALLTREKSIIRKITEWAMAIKLDAQVAKDDILTIYLNDAAYGGNIYGIQTASQYFFGKDVGDLSLTEIAYLTSLPNAPSYYSPYGNHIDELENRKNLVLKLMLDQNMITNEQYQTAKVEKVIWQKNITEGKAMHFVFFVRDYLEQKYGKDIVDTGGLKVITSLDYDMQSQAEEIVHKYALENARQYQATNAGLVAINPKTGQVLTMVGSRDYFDTDNFQGNFNVTTSPRQPGSAFKPIAYATAFMKGYNPSTVLFDVQTEFSTTCANGGGCYSPENYDGKFRGPVSMRNALAQSLNIPAVKTLYLAGVKDSIATAQKLGITSLNQNGDYGLSLVLGSGEVSLLQLTNAYGVFANRGVYNPVSFILSVIDRDGNLLEQYSQNSVNAVPDYVADEINDVLSDNVARTPLYGANSGLYFGARPVAAKTGTTNEYRDTWTIGYTPSLVVGVWAGNNDNSRINKGMSGMVAVPMWSEFMKTALKDKPIENFVKANVPSDLTPNPDTPPVHGKYCYTSGGINYSHSILASNDSQYSLWKVPADNYMSTNLCPFSDPGEQIINGTSTASSTDPNSSTTPPTSTPTNPNNPFPPIIIPTTTLPVHIN